MTKHTEVMKLAQELRALADRFSEGWHEGIKIDASDIVLLSDAAEALASEAKEQPAQQETMFTYDQVKAHIQAAMMSAAQRTWVGLTDEDIKEAEWLLSAIKEHEAYTLQEQLLVEGVDVFARAIEAKLREKNGITKEQT